MAAEPKVEPIKTESDILEPEVEIVDPTLEPSDPRLDPLEPEIVEPQIANPITSPVSPKVSKLTETISHLKNNKRKYIF